MKKRKPRKYETYEAFGCNANQKGGIKNKKNTKNEDL